MENFWDIVIAVAYFAIPVQLYLLGRTQQKILVKQNSSNPLFYTTLFCCIIASCGTTHLGQVYWRTSTNYTKPITAIVSVATAASLLWLAPIFEKLGTHAPVEILQLLTTSNALAREGGVCFSIHGEDGGFKYWLGNHAVFGAKIPASVFDVMSKQDRKLCSDGSRTIKRCQLQCGTAVDAVIVPGFASGFMVVSQRQQPDQAVSIKSLPDDAHPSRLSVVSVASVLEKAASLVNARVVTSVSGVDCVVADADWLLRGVLHLLAGARSDNGDQVIALHSERDRDSVKVSVSPPAPQLDLGRLSRDAQCPGGHCGADQTSAWFTFPYPVLRVLVVEDTPSIRVVIVRSLTAHGHQVDQAVDGAAGLNMALATTYDVIVTDVNMPNLDGRAMARAIFESHSDAARRPKVVAVTTDVLTLGQGGPHFDAVLPKPITKTDLLNQVNSAPRIPRIARNASAPIINSHQRPVDASATRHTHDVAVLPC